MCSDSEKNMSAFADQNHAPSLTCVRLEFFSFSQDIYKSIADTRDQNDLYLLLLQIFHVHLPGIVNIIEMHPYKNKPCDKKLFFVASDVVKNSFESVFVWKVTQISSSFPPNCSSYFEHNAFNNSGVADKYQKVSAGFTCPK